MTEATLYDIRPVLPGYQVLIHEGCIKDNWAGNYLDTTADETRVFWRPTRIEAEKLVDRILGGERA